MQQTDAAIATTRFSMGARPGELRAAQSDPRGWLKGQIRGRSPLVVDSRLRTAAACTRTMLNQRRTIGDLRKGRTDIDEVEDVRRQILKARNTTLLYETEARNRHAVDTNTGFAERWARFWCNHFTVSDRNPQTPPLAGAFEREAIRPNVFASFLDLLAASTLHQGMLVFLGNYRSVGPNSRYARRQGFGLNENLAREILELHTLGVKGGYDQDDVVGLAKILTGWSIATKGKARHHHTGDVLFINGLHEPGTKQVLGKTYREAGGDEIFAVLGDLVRHPATARFIATKLARHFVSDTPSLRAVERLELVFHRTGGDLKALAEAVIDLDDAWKEPLSKLKTPDELLISAGRLLGFDPVFASDFRAVYRALGQTPLQAPSPAGWSDEAADWASPDALMKRLEWANAVSKRVAASVPADHFLNEALGPLVASSSRRTILGGSKDRDSLTLALMTPEFQRR